MFGIRNQTKEAGVTSADETTFNNQLQDAFTILSQIVSFPIAKTGDTILFDIQLETDKEYWGAAWTKERYGTSRDFGSLDHFPKVGNIAFNFDYGVPPTTVLLHEIIHVLGVGDTWTSYNTDNIPITEYHPDRKDLADPLFLVNDGVETNRYYHGTNGFREYKSYLTQAGYNTDSIVGVPVENNYGAGSRLVHTEETNSVAIDNRYVNGVYHPGLDDEVITPLANGSMAISRITIGMLEDIGYLVDYSKADQFRIKRDYVELNMSSSDTEIKIHNNKVEYNDSTYDGEWRSDYIYVSEKIEGNDFFIIQVDHIGNGIVILATSTGNPSDLSLTVLNAFITQFNNNSSWYGVLRDGTSRLRQIRMRMMPIQFSFNHSSNKFYKPNSLAPCGVGSAGNSRIKSRRT